MRTAIEAEIVLGAPSSSSRVPFQFLYLQCEALGRAGDERGIGFPCVGDIDIELELIAIGVVQVETMGDMMVGSTDDLGARLFELGIGPHEFGIGRAYLEPNMVEARLGTEFLTRDGVNLEEEEFMVGTAR